MSKREYRDYLNDIYECINDIESFVKDMSYEEFLKDKKTINAVVRSIEIIGEATKHIPKSIKDKSVSIPWKQITGMRNKVIHEYFGVDTNTLWITVTQDVPSIKPAIESLIKQITK